MNQREPTSEPQGPGWAFPCLALLLLPLLSGARAPALTQLPPQAGLTQQNPYLVALGAPPLRFQDPVPATDLAIRPPKPGAPKLIISDHTSTATEAAGDVSFADVSHTPRTPPTPETRHETTDTLSSETADNPSKPARTPLPILPDEVRPQARPEDFLPFFQIPAPQSGDVNVIVPVPRSPGSTATALPASSATYTQTPR
jgi:hypothetical protein